MSRTGWLVTALVVGALALGTVAWWASATRSDRSESAGQLVTGRTIDGRYEVREITRSDSPLVAGDYEIVADVDAPVVVRLVAAQDRLYAGRGPEVVGWLDAQGPQVFVGTEEGAAAYVDAGGDEDTPAFPFWLVPVWFVPILVAVVASRRDQARSTRTETP